MPASCPDDHAHVIDAARTQLLDTVLERDNKITNLPLSPFDRVLTSEETVLIEIKPGMGVSRLRDVTQTVGAASVVNDIGSAEYKLQARGPGARALLRSAERGRYVAGMAAEVGIGGHLEAPLGAGQSLKFGLFDDQNGFYFEISNHDLSVNVLKDGVVTCIPRNQFNVDQMIGTGDSKIYLNPSKGYIWMIRFSWYGYGIVEFAVATDDPFGEQHIYAMHRYYSQVRASVSVPNLPLSVLLETGSDILADQTCGAFITGRKYSVLGKYTPTIRANSAHRTFSQMADGRFPVMSIRKKAGFVGSPVTLESVESYSGDAVVIIQVRTGMELTGAQWGNVPDQVSSETAVEYDSSATAATGGIVVFQGFVRTGAATNVASIADFYLTDADAVTVIVKDPAAAGALNVGLRWIEEW